MDKQITEHNLKVSDIDASLNYGKIHIGKGWTATLILLLVLSILMMVVATIGIFDRTYDSSSKFMIIFGYIFGGFMLLVTLLMYLYLRRGQKRAARWLEDAVLIEAKSTLLGTRAEVRFPAFFAEAAWIRVSFYYNGVKYTRESSHKGEKLYLAVYRKYADRNIMIAYSPKYDQVMLVKDNNKNLSR